MAGSMKRLAYPEKLFLCGKKAPISPSATMTIYTTKPMSIYAISRDAGPP